MSTMTRMYLILLWMMICIVFLAGYAKAEDSYTIYKIPGGHRVSVAGEALQAYTLNEYKQLLTVDSDLHAADAQLVLKLTEIDKLQLVVKDLQTVNKLNIKEVVLLQKDLSRKDLLLSTTVKENVSLHAKLSRKQRLLRVGGGVVGALIGGLTLGLIVGK